MGLININNLSFTYKGAETPALTNVSLEINPGEMILIAGHSGSGKSTLLSVLKPEIRESGDMTGEILLDGQPMPEETTRETVAAIGYMCQNPEAQIVTDKVYRELTYGLENLGLPQQEIMARCAEISAFLGISHLFRKNTWELSGGQKQVLNLAALLVMEPKVLLLDEPTSRLDPVSAEEFLYLLHRVKNEFGLSVVLVEHDLDKVIHLCDKMCILDNGRVTISGTPRQVLENKDLAETGPTAWKIWRGCGALGDCPISLEEARRFARSTLPQKVVNHPQDKVFQEKPVLETRDLWYKHQKNQQHVLRGVNLCLHRGEFKCVMGANGSGKSTLLKALTDKAPGVSVVGQQRMAKLPQDVTELFLHDTVKGELEHVLDALGLEPQKAEERLRNLCQELNITELLGRNPFKLSGGEQKRIALAKVLLAEPTILLLDEPTGSLDPLGKKNLAKILLKMCQRDIAILAVTHDTELVAESHGAMVLFDGAMSGTKEPHEFLCGNRFYTTKTVSMCRGWLDGVVTPDEAIGAYKEEQ